MVHELRARASRNLWIATSSVALFATPVLLDLAWNGWTRVFRYFAADAYLYLTVGRNFAAQGRFTIDGIHIANGFHPLWQLYVGLIYSIGRLVSLAEPAILVIILLTNVALIAAALWLLCRAYARALGVLPAWSLFLPLGVFGLVVAPIQTAFGPRGSLWGFVNGMESGLVLFLYGLLVLHMVRPSFLCTTRSALAGGSVLALLLLARLDTVFLGIALCAVMGAEALIARDPSRFRRAVLFGVPVLLALGGYVTVNVATTGMALPASALTKSAGSGIAKLDELAKLFSHSQLHATHSWRLAQLLVPMAAAIAALLTYRRVWVGRGTNPFERVLVVTALFTLLLGLYGFFVVPTLDQGHWYYPIPILFVSLFAFHALCGRAAPQSPTAAAGFAAAALLVFAGLYYPSKTIGPPIFTDFMVNKAPRARRHYPTPPRILSFDDGIVAWATGWPVMTARGFMLDREAIEAFRRPDHSLLALAQRRGFDRITAVFYFSASRLSSKSPSPAIRRELAGQLKIPDAELARFIYSVDYLSADGRFGIIRMQPATLQENPS